MHNKKQFNWEVLSGSILAQADGSRSSAVYYVGVFKESESGLLFNERMLVIQDRNFTIFYTKHFKTLPQLLEMEKQGTTAIKERAPVMSFCAERESNLITVAFTSEECEKKRWVFKFGSSKLADKWHHLLREQQEKCAARTLKSRGTKSTGFASDFSSILANSAFLENYGSEREAESEGRAKRPNVRKIEHEYI